MIIIFATDHHGGGRGFGKGGMGDSPFGTSVASFAETALQRIGMAGTGAASDGKLGTDRQGGLGKL